MKRGLLTESEEQLVIDLHARLLVIGGQRSHQIYRTSETSSASSSPNQHSPRFEENTHSQFFQGISNEDSIHVSLTENNSAVVDHHKPRPLVFQSVCDDDKLLSYLLGDNEPPVPDHKEKKSNNCTTEFTSWDDCAAWLMDCKDFESDHFGFRFLKSQPT
ncbi:hypothetical protein LXL04_026552 [Taraxacum kok-saghyz]